MTRILFLRTQPAQQQPTVNFPPPTTNTLVHIQIHTHDTPSLYFEPLCRLFSFFSFRFGSSGSSAWATSKHNLCSSDSSQEQARLCTVRFIDHLEEMTLTHAARTHPKNTDNSFPTGQLFILGTLRLLLPSFLPPLPTPPTYRFADEDAQHYADCRRPWPWPHAFRMRGA